MRASHALTRHLACAVSALFLGFTTEVLPQRNLAVSPGSASTSEVRVALVIGNSAYKDSPLANPVNDATDVARVLEDAGFKVSLWKDANYLEMRQAIRQFEKELRRADVGLFYFAGHGIQLNDTNYLLPVAADVQSEADAEDLSINANYVLRTMEQAQVKVSIVILDACRNNPFTRGFRSVSRGLAQMSAATGSIIAFATAPGSVAADGSERNGVYTKHLLSSLNHPDTDILKVFQRTRAGVVKETGGRQTPWESTSLIGDFYFKPAGQASSLITAPAKPAQVAMTAATSALGGDRPARRAGTVFRDCADCPEMVVIPAGSLVMGSPRFEPRRDADEGPEHAVKISESFAAGKYELTRAQFSRFVEESGRSMAGGCYVWNGSQWNNDASKNWRDPGFSQTDNDPVTCVNWHDASSYVEWLSRKTGKSYRLLSEAQWEYVARGGTRTAFNTGAAINPTQANYNSSASYAGSVTAASHSQTIPVGSYVPNAFGLHDVHGNVWEWTQDCYNARYDGAPSDGSAWTSGDCKRRVLRGGAWSSPPWDLRSATRYPAPAADRFSGRVGFRVARTVP